MMGLLAVYIRYDKLWNITIWLVLGIIRIALVSFLLRDLFPQPQLLSSGYWGNVTKTIVVTVSQPTDVNGGNVNPLVSTPRDHWNRGANVDPPSAAPGFCCPACEFFVAATVHVCPSCGFQPAASASRP